MDDIFNIKIEFNPENIDNKISELIIKGSKNYVCIVDGNVLTNANTNETYNDIINSSGINLCDGSSIAFFASILNRKRFSTYTGPEIFTKMISKQYKQFFLGNTIEVLDNLKEELIGQGKNINQFMFKTLPFKDVNDFEYEQIAEDINSFTPEIIWVSLGAPKQEIFMSKLLPFLDKGLMFGIGAAFNFYLKNDQFKRAPEWIRLLKLEWLYRSIKEPNRIGKRAWKYAKLLPRLIYQEVLKNK